MRARFQAQVQASLPSAPELVLVTDLDGTLLAGEPLIGNASTAG